MAIKLVLLKSGVELICDLTNMEIGEDDNKKVVGYYLGRPCIVDAEPTGEPNEFTIQLKQWMPLSVNPLIPIAAGWVVTIVDPVKQLYDVYKQQIMTPKGVQEWLGRGEEASKDYLDKNEDDPFDGLSPEEYAIKEAQKLTTELGEKYGHSSGNPITNEDNENGQDNQDSSTDESTDSDN
jgi:hypothetical protein